MIYLIGGSPRVGKSTLARLLAAKKQIPLIAADDISAVIHPYISEENYAEKFPLSVARRETNFSNDSFYAQYSAGQTVEFYYRQAETFWAGFKSFINYVLADEHEYVVEGWQLLPHLIDSVITPENEAQITARFLYKTDVADIVSSLKSGKSKHDWVINNTKEAATFEKIGQMVSAFGERIAAEAKKYNLEAINTDFDFERKIKSLSESI